MNKHKLKQSILVVITIMSLLSAFTQPVYAQDEVEDTEILGTIQSIDEENNSFILETETGEIITIYTDSDFDFTSIQISDQVKVEGQVNEDGSINASLTEVNQSEDDDTEQLDPADSSTLNTGYYCSQSEDPHPFGARLAERFESDYSTMQTWFCEGSGWGEIMLAMKTSKITEGDPAELIAARKDGSGWGQIWQEAGLIGKPDKEEKINEQKDEEKPNADKTPGPPEEKEKKPKKVK